MKKKQVNKQENEMSNHKTARETNRFLHIEEERREKNSDDFSLLAAWQSRKKHYALKTLIMFAQQHQACLLVPFVFFALTLSVANARTASKTTRCCCCN